MLLTRYTKPFGGFGGRRNFDLFNEFLDSVERGTTLSNVADFNPSVNTREGKEAYHVELDLPGIKKEDVDVSVDGNILTISGSREFKDEVKEEDYYKIESSYGSFSRSFTLPQKVDAENIRAASSEGVLEIIIPKLDLPDDKVKKIEIH